MKKSLLALAVVFAASSATASAATVYDKDGTSLSVGGRVQSVLFNGWYKKAGEKDTSLVNSARFNIAGTTKVNDYLTVLAFSEWDMADGEKKNIGDNLVSREQYVGADFGSFGKLIAGKTLDSTRQVMAATDIFEYVDVQNDTGINGDRRNGLFRYDYNSNGLFASVTYETAADDQKIFGKKFDVQNGYAVALGYTFDNVVFGPLSIKAGFNFIDGRVGRVDSVTGRDIVSAWNIKWVPILDTNYMMPSDMEEFKEFATAKSVVNPNVLREGIVLRDPTNDFSFKNVSREYLLKHNG